MARRGLALALSAIVAASPVAAAQPDPAPVTAAPPGSPGTLYCMHVELTGNVVEPVRCWTRDEWAEQGVDVDREWAKEGVRTIG